MPKNYSENIAKLFEIVNYFLLIPIILTGILLAPFIFYLFVIAIILIFSKQDFDNGLTILIQFIFISAIIIFGIRLMFGYYRHSRGKLDRKKVDRLWVKTICFNAIFFFPSFYLHLQCLITEECSAQMLSRLSYIMNASSAFSLVFLILTCWWGIAIILPFVAVFSTEDEKS